MAHSCRLNTPGNLMRHHARHAAAAQGGGGTADMVARPDRGSDRSARLTVIVQPPVSLCSRRQWEGCSPARSGEAAPTLWLGLEAAQRQP